METHGKNYVSSAIVFAIKMTITPQFPLLREAMPE